MLNARTRWCFVVLVALTLAAPAPGRGQGGDPLPIGSPATGRTASGTPATYTFNADSAGFLTVVVRDVGDTDLYIVVADASGQQLPDGRSDQDLMGDTGAEQATLTIPRPGTYQVRIETFGSGGGEFRIASGWIPFPDIEEAPDPDGTPDTAQALSPGSPVQDTLEPNGGDPWDWFAVTAPQAGIITVATEGDGDLAIEVFAEGNYTEALERSDQDMQDSSGNESLTVRAEAGQTFYFKVEPVFQSANLINYTIRAGVM